MRDRMKVKALCKIGVLLTLFNLESVTTTADPGLSSTIHLDAKPAAAPVSARSAAATTASTTSTTSDVRDREETTTPLSLPSRIKSVKK
jgi:hypothetical protein